MIPAYEARLARLGEYREQPQRNLAYIRNQWARKLRDRLPAKRANRQAAKACREEDERKARRNRRWNQRRNLYTARYVILTSRLQIQKRIRPAGKSLKSRWRWKNEVLAATATDPEYLALRKREAEFDQRYERISDRWNATRVAAGVLMIDTRAIARAKVEAFLETQG